MGGFSLHAGVAAAAHESHKLERLCRYIARPAISEKRLSISPQGKVRYELKTPWRNGTTHVEFEPIEFIAKLAALVPPPRAHLTRFHGVFAPNAKLRAQLTPSGRGKRLATDAQSTDANFDRRTPVPEGCSQTRRLLRCGAWQWRNHCRRTAPCIHPRLAATHPVRKVRQAASPDNDAAVRAKPMALIGGKVRLILSGATRAIE